MKLASILGIRGARDKPKDSYGSTAYSFFFGRSNSGKIVNERTAMQTTAVYSCVRILSEAIASLPVHLYRYTDTGKERVYNHPLYYLLHDEPNPEMTSFVFRETLMSHLLIWGNAYAQIIRDGTGRVLGLYPLLPDKVEVDRDDKGELYYIYNRYSDENPNFEDYGRVYLPQEDVLHIPGLGFDGLVGYALQVGTDSEGGYLVPDEFEHTLVEALEEENFFRSIATVIQTSSGDRKIPVVATKGTASWIDEEGAYPESDDSFGQVSIGAYKVATMLKVSDELLNDSVFNLEAYISKEFGRRIGTKEEEAFFTGDGKGKPTGIFNATGGASEGVTTAAANITFDDVMDLYYAVKSPYRKKAVWVLNDTTVKALRKLKDNNGNYIWQPSVQAGQPDMILNRPYHTSAYVPEIAAGAKVMAFGDFSYYWIADRQGRSFKRLNELFAATGQVGFLASQRVDGKLILSEAVKTMAIKGSGTGA